MVWTLWETAPPVVSVVIVTHESRDALSRTLPALGAQLEPGDELIVVDNASADGTPAVVEELAPEAIVVRNAGNDGFAAAANAGAARASGDLLVFLNPDAAPQPGFREAIERPLRDGRGWAAWMGLVTAEGGRVVNTSGGVVHFTGVAWAGDAGQPVERTAREPHEVGFASGACLAVPADVWRRAGGFPGHYFMYCEDVDLSLRLRLSGGLVGIEPAAVVDHEYEFAKGSRKWRLLERNRWATLVRTYPGALLVLLAPVLLATELAVLAAGARGGWLGAKLLGSLDALRALPRLTRERRAIQAGRTVGAAEFAAWLSADVSSEFIGPVARSRLVQGALSAYWRVVRALLSASARS
jgi:GT2 family glycosyltransferase